jgi:hypothetical protein
MHSCFNYSNNNVRPHLEKYINKHHNNNYYYNLPMWRLSGYAWGTRYLLPPCTWSNGMSSAAQFPYLSCLDYKIAKPIYPVGELSVCQHCLVMPSMKSSTVNGQAFQVAGPRIMEQYARSDISSVAIDVLSATKKSLLPAFIS